MEKRLFGVKKENKIKGKNQGQNQMYKIKEEKGTQGFNRWYDWIR